MQGIDWEWIADILQHEGGYNGLDKDLYEMVAVKIAREFKRIYELDKRKDYICKHWYDYGEVDIGLTEVCRARENKKVGCCGAKNQCEYPERYEPQIDRCFLCKEDITFEKHILRNFTDSPKDEVGYKEVICEGCDEWCESHQQG